MLNYESIPEWTVNNYDVDEFKKLLLEEKIPLESIEKIQAMDWWGGVNFLDLLWNDINNNEVKIHDGMRYIKMVSMICQDQVNQLLLTKIHWEEYSKYSLSWFVPSDESDYIKHAIREIKEESGYDIFPEEIIEMKNVDMLRESPKLPWVETLTQGKVFKINYGWKFDTRKKYHDWISEWDDVNHDNLIIGYQELIKRVDINPTYLNSIKEFKNIIKR